MHSAISSQLRLFKSIFGNFSYMAYKFTLPILKLNAEH